MTAYILTSCGRRQAPAPVLLLLTCGALGFHGEQRFNLAAVVEFIHTATLLHDDVVDESVMRRGNATANETFGNPASVLVGDFLYSRAFQMMVEAGNMRIMEVLADATNVIAEGEVLQLMNMHNAAIDEAGYLRVIRSKTAKLFEASSPGGAILAGRPPELEEASAPNTAGARYSLPGHRRRARLRRRRRRDGQEPRRRPARGQGTLPLIWRCSAAVPVSAP
jgi:octaprenyl-diphosphate synthase